MWGEAYEDGICSSIPFTTNLQHLISPVLVAILGLISAVIIDQYVESINMNRYFAAFFVIIFTMAMGITWEIGEFISDQILLTQAQHGLNDTMWDLIFDLIRWRHR